MPGVPVEIKFSLCSKCCTLGTFIRTIEKVCTAQVWKFRRDSSYSFAQRRPSLKWLGTSCQTVPSLAKFWVAHRQCAKYRNRCWTVVMYGLFTEVASALQFDVKLDKMLSALWLERVLHIAVAFVEDKHLGSGMQAATQGWLSAPCLISLRGFWTFGWTKSRFSLEAPPLVLTWRFLKGKLPKHTDTVCQPVKIAPCAC